MNRIICRHCGNTDSDKMDFTPDRRYVYCHICRSTTPLYSDFKVLEVEGVQTLQTRLQSGETLLSLKKYQEAEEVFGELTRDYAGDYRTWLGLFRARSREMTEATFDWDVLNNARTVARDDPEAASMLDEIRDQCRVLMDLQNQIQQKQTRLDEENRSIGELDRSLSSAREPAMSHNDAFDAAVSGLENEIAESEKVLNQIPLKKVFLAGCLALLSYLWYQHANYAYYLKDRTSTGDSLMMLVWFLLMAAMILLFLGAVVARLISAPRRIQARKEISERKQRILNLQEKARQARLKSEKDHQAALSDFNRQQDQRREAIRRLQDSTRTARQEIQRLRQEYDRHVQTVRQL